MARVLVLHHSPTATLQRVLHAVTEQTQDMLTRDFPELLAVEVVCVPALSATADDVRCADAVLILTPANFGYMSGALKHFFDSHFLDLGGALDADGQSAAASRSRLPCGLVVHGRYDTAGAVRSVTSVSAALGWDWACPPLELLGELTSEHLEQCVEVSGTLTALAAQSAT